MSDFTSGKRKLIPAVLIYATCGDQVLMMHRDREGDYHLGKWNGLGGKMEADESPMDAMVREWSEESVLPLPANRFQLRGVIQFPNFIEVKNQDWIVYIGTLQLSEAEQSRIPQRSTEGALEWISKDQISSLNLWEGDRVFLPKVMHNQSFLGTIWYRDGRVLNHWFSDL